MLTWRRAVAWTCTVGVLVLFIAVPVLRDHRWMIVMPYYVVLTAVALVRGKPEGIRFLVLSILVALLAIALSGLALWINIWVGVAFILVVPTTALAIAYRRDQRAAMH